ncbi:MAG: hypothetical protein U0528_09255 [Anaerolineae bacterium]
MAAHKGNDQEARGVGGDGAQSKLGIIAPWRTISGSSAAVRMRWNTPKNVRHPRLRHPQIDLQPWITQPVLAGESRSAVRWRIRNKPEESMFMPDYESCGGSPDGKAESILHQLHEGYPSR